MLMVPLQYDAIAENFILTEAPRKQIEIEVFGSGYELLGEQLSLDKSRIKVDLNLARKVNHESYGFAAEKLRNEVLANLDKDLNLRRILTDSIRFRTQKKISKEIKVVPRLEIDYNSAYHLRGEVKVEPQKVLISGPEKVVQSMELIQTKLIKLSDVSDTITKEVELDVSEVGEGVIISQQMVDLLVPVEKFTEKQLILPLRVEKLVKDVNLRTYPDEIKVVLIVPLSKYEIVNSDLLSAKVEFNEESIYKKKLKVKLSGLPDYAKLLRIEPEKVEFIVKK